MMRTRQAATAAALFFSLLTLGAILMVVFGFDSQVAGYQFAEQREWIPQFGLQYKLGVDGISILMLLLTGLLTPIVIGVSWLSISDRTREYMAAMLLLETGMVGVFISLDLVLFYVFWEVVLIPMYLIIGVWGGPRRIYAAIKFFLFTFVGSVLMLVAIIAIGLDAGSFDIEALPNIGITQSLQFWVFIAFFAAFAIKIPMFPFHTWLPDAHVEAPTGGSVILAGVLLKMGGYGFLRLVLPLSPQAVDEFRLAVIVLSVVGIIYGAMVAMSQRDVKKTDRLLFGLAHGFRNPGHFLWKPTGPRRGNHPDVLARPDHRRAFPLRRRGLRSHPHPSVFPIWAGWPNACRYSPQCLAFSPWPRWVCRR